MIHSHIFKLVKEGVILEDVFHYHPPALSSISRLFNDNIQLPEELPENIPAGYFGRIINRIAIRPVLKRLFLHRREKIKRKFGIC